MKYKTRVTLIVCTVMDEKKVPLAVIGKPKNPVRFRLETNVKAPMMYMDQRNAWFDKDVIAWWIMQVLGHITLTRMIM